MAIADSRGAGIYWRETGAGPPLLLIMGIGYSSDMWHHVEPLLAAQHRLILADNRGVGRSSAIDGDCSIADMADDMLAVLDAAGIPAANVFGMSMGGYIAQELTLRHPQRVHALVLGCTSAGGDRAVPAEPEVWNAIEARRGMTAEEGVRALIPYIYAPSTPKARIEADLAVRLRSYPSAESYDAQLAAIRAWQSWDRLEEIAAPTLVLHGDCDRLIPPENGRNLAAAIDGARYQEIEDASHIFITDQPEQSAALVNTFLAERPPAG